MRRLFRNNQSGLKHALIVGGILFFSSFQGSNVADEYTIKGMFIYNFTKYIDWDISKQGKNFVVAIFGKSDVYQSLQRIAVNKKINAKSIEVRSISSVDDALDCQVIFIPRLHNNILKETIDKLGSKGILIITEDKDMAIKGSCINIITIDGKVKFELNESAAKRDGLKLASQLEALAILIK